jgi:tetratricopeptide (TPR) repeat protein
VKTNPVMMQRVRPAVGGAVRARAAWLGFACFAVLASGQAAGAAIRLQETEAEAPDASSAPESQDTPAVANAPILNLPAANDLDHLGLDDVDRAEAGSWSDFFVEHQPSSEVMAMIPPQLAGLANQAQASYSRADFPACLAQSREVLRMLPDFPPSLLVYGTAAFRLRRHGDSKTALERFQEVAPTEVWRTQVLGHALYSLGEFEAARDHYLAVMENAPDPRSNSLGARRGLALANYRIGDTEVALAGLNQVVVLDPGNAEAHAWLAQVHFDREELDEALASARKAMELAPFEPRAYFLAYRVLFEKADLAQAGKAAQVFESEAEELQSRWEALSATASEITTLRNRLLFHVGDPTLLRALAEHHRDLGDISNLTKVLSTLLATHDVLDPTTIARRTFAIEALRDAGARDQAVELRSATLLLFPGAEGLPQL